MAINRIMWSTTLRLEPSQIKLLKQQCKELLDSDTSCHDIGGDGSREKRFFTTYKRGDAPLDFGKDASGMYQKIFDRILKDYGVYETTTYYGHIWVQMYNSTTESHLAHTHYSGGEAFSWVHFIDTPKQKCFYFLDSSGKKHYPEQQKSGDFIVFTPWTPHGIDPVEEDGFDRIVSAGNVFFSQFQFGSEYVESNTWNKTTLFVTN